MCGEESDKSHTEHSMKPLLQDYNYVNGLCAVMLTALKPTIFSKTDPSLQLALKTSNKQKGEIYTQPFQPQRSFLTLKHVFKFPHYVSQQHESITI